MKQKSIKTRIMIAIILMAIIPSVLLGMLSVYATLDSTLGLAETSIGEITTAIANRLHYQLRSYINVAVAAGTNPSIADTDVPVQEKEAVITAIAESEGFERGNIIGSDGISVFSGQDFSDREYFQKAMRGETFVSDPLLSKVTGEYAIIVAAPIWEGGVHGSAPIGCVYFAPPANFLTDIMQSINVSENNLAYMINSDGIIIADKDSETVKSQTSIIKNAETDSSYAALADIHKKMIAGETGCDMYSKNGSNAYIAYSPIDAPVSGWFLAVEDPLSNYLKDVWLNLIIIGVMMVIFCTVALILGSVISNGIAKPIKACSERIKKLAAGDIGSPAYKSEAKDEVGVLARSTGTLVNNLQTIIYDIDRILSEIAKGNLAVETDHNTMAYVGDFSSIIDALQRITRELSGAIGKIETSAIQVAAGSDQVSNAAQNLSQGSTEQAASIEDLALSINDISVKIENNLTQCKNAKDAVDTSAAYMQEADDQMKQMTSAMDKISAASEKIEKVIKTIEDIAFQTNILALNAAVEAAKVGAAGKGFAVVADEVRNLAGKSQDAVKSTSELIEESAEAVREGIEIADRTAETLNKAVEYSSELTKIVDKVAESSGEQSKSISKVTEGIDQISSVVQNNSATAEESAAASEQLNGQATLMKGLVEKFTLRK